MPSYDSCYDEDAAEHNAMSRIDRKRCKKVIEEMFTLQEEVKEAERLEKKQERPRNKGQRGLLKKGKANVAQKKKEKKDQLKLKVQEVTDTAIATFKSSRAGKKWVHQKATELLADWKAKNLLENLQLQVSAVHKSLHKAGFPEEWRNCCLEFLRLTHLQKAKHQIKQSRLCQEG